MSKEGMKQRSSVQVGQLLSIKIDENEFESSKYDFSCNFERIRQV